MRYLSSIVGFSFLGVLILSMGIFLNSASVSTRPEQLIGQSSSSLDSAGDNKPSPPRGSDRRQDG